MVTRVAELGSTGIGTTTGHVQLWGLAGAPAETAFGEYLVCIAYATILSCHSLVVTRKILWKSEGACKEFSHIS